MTLFGFDPDSESDIIEAHAGAMLLAEACRDLRLIRKALVSNGK